MAIIEATGLNGEGSNEPIKFTASKEDRRAERVRRRAEKSPQDVPETIEPTLLRPQLVAAPDPQEFRSPTKVRKSLLARLMPSWMALSFIVMVAIPTAATMGYYWLIASPQYQVEMQFSVRGSNQSSMAAFGLSSLFGNSVQSGDSYVVSSYALSTQLIRDAKEQLGVDLRTFYSKPDIDFMYRIDPNMPLEKFTGYWQDMIEVSFNSTTGNTTLYVYAFSADDAKKVADTVIKVAEKLVNTLSEKSRQQMTLVASGQVDRAEERLRKVREEIRKLRVEEKAFDPSQIAALESSLTSSIESQLSQLKTRKSALLQSVSPDSPNVRVIQRQIDALEEQLAVQKSKLGDNNPSPSSSKTARTQADDESNLAEVFNKFEELTVEQGFATQAYTTSLAAFEAALAEAQKQDRYFATFVEPVKPEIALYPMRLLDSFIAFLVFLAAWMFAQFFYRSFRDHAV
jgi:capsular polysaccharide transport system permease protein